ncbi:MAG TPA: hypothetical protein VD833_00485 [Vicinamibacterales bacterium]|nr:hypothetical protein [Vicinamibacterales bacterium]
MTRRTGPALAVACVVLIGAGCRTTPAPLAHTFESVDALAESVLDAVARRDADTLQSLALSEAEFRSRIWPELPASRPERNVPFDYAWRDLSQKSGMYLRQTLARYGGQRYHLVRVEFLGTTTAYRSFDVARRTQLVVRDRSGAEQAIRLFGSVLRSGSQHKLFSYVVD